jgi:hypothetical protein
LVVALAPEARPLVHHYGLRAIEGPFRQYQKEDVALVVSGTGKAAAAAATAYLYARTGEPKRAVWFNVGIAGHRERTVGEAIIARTIIDHGSGRAWELSVPEVTTPSATVMTVDRGEEKFETDYVYEMEAAGFYPTAVRLSSPERVRCVKVISDNLESSPHLTKKQIEGLIAGKLDEIVTAIELEA